MILLFLCVTWYISPLSHACASFTAEHTILVAYQKPYIRDANLSIRDENGLLAGTVCFVVEGIGQSGFKFSFLGDLGWSLFSLTSRGKVLMKECMEH